MKILSIDAWADGENGWTWNNWYEVSNITEDKFDILYNRELMEDHAFTDWFIEQGFLNTPNTKYYTDDDGYNIIICFAETMKPLYAIEYGAD